MKFLSPYTLPFLAAVLAVPASLHAANWTFISLQPTAGTVTQVNATTSTQQGGYSQISGNVHAVIWSGTAASFVDLNPAGAQQSWLQGMAGNQQVGIAELSNSSHAVIWSGTALSFVDVHPAGSFSSELEATTGTQQVGGVNTGVQEDAGIWSGTAASFVDVNPAGAVGSELFATTGTLQGGVAYFGSVDNPHAGLWAGTAASFVDLNPPGAASSQVNGMAGNQQVGYADRRAALWFGTAASFTDLTPPGAVSAALSATNGTYQVGEIGTPAGPHAGIWTGSTASFVDLNAYLPSPYTTSSATAIWSDGTKTLVTGSANDPTTFNDLPGLWEGTPSTVAIRATTTRTGVTFTITNPGNAPEPVQLTSTKVIHGAQPGPVPVPPAPKSPIVFHYTLDGVNLTSRLAAGTATASIPAQGSAKVVVKITTRFPLAFRRTIHLQLTASSQADPSKSGSAKATIVLKAAGSVKAGKPPR